ncbi:MAG: methyltransferase domain-containing protein [Phycisphaerales bacterium]|nr:methyltransferase domain-containing protein [Phycisphaerales bacterium]
MSRRFALWIAAPALLVLSITACRTTDTGSVRPGVNDDYRNANVAEWQARFESESREIYVERERIADAAGIREGLMVADIGAGTGFFTDLFARRVGPSGLVYAVDITPEFIAHIDAHARAEGLHNVRTVLCPADSVDLPDASIDVAFVCDTYHHFEFPARSLRSIHRALRPRGQLVVIDFDRVPGVSREWVMNHVRAGREQIIDEITAAGFELLSRQNDAPYLKENYLLRFRKIDEPGIASP